MNKQNDPIKGYKAFDKGLVCRNTQYEIGKTHEVGGDLKICKNGIHFCKNPFDVLDHYNLCESEFAEVDVVGDIVTDDHKKFATNKLTITAKLDLAGFCKAAFKFIWESINPGDAAKLAASGDAAQLAASGDAAQLAASGYAAKLAASGDAAQLAASGYAAKLAASGDAAKLAASGYAAQLAASGDDAKLAASGDAAKLAASGDAAQLAASGDAAQLAASGDAAQLAASGDAAKLAASGDDAKLAASGDAAQLAASGDAAQLEVSGSNSVAAGIGINNKVKGIIGTWITLAEWKYDTTVNKYLIVCVKSAQIDGEILKANTWYELVDGEFKETNNG